MTRTRRETRRRRQAASPGPGRFPRALPRAAACLLIPHEARGEAERHLHRIRRGPDWLYLYRGRLYSQVVVTAEGHELRP